MYIQSRQSTNESTVSIRIKGYLLAVLVLIAAGIALPRDTQAAVITLNLRTFGPATSAPDTWELFAQTSAGDNDGIAGYNIPVLNAATLDHNVIGQEIGGVLINGFTFNDDTGNVIFGGMNSVIPATVIYGVGNGGFVVPAPPPGFTNVGMPNVGDPFAPVLLASGTGGWLAVDIDSSANANVWTLNESLTNGVLAEAASIEILIDRINTSARVPEPTSILLLGLGLAALGFARRRHQIGW